MQLYCIALVLNTFICKFSCGVLQTFRSFTNRKYSKYYVTLYFIFNEWRREALKQSFYVDSDMQMCHSLTHSLTPV